MEAKHGREMVGEEEFRRVLGHFATGVTVVASKDRHGESVGLTVNAFTSVSLSPPLVLICIHQNAEGHDALLDAGHFSVSILEAGQGELAMTFAQETPEHRFQEVAVRDVTLGSPLFEGALAWVECRIRNVFPGGDHSIVVGEVVESFAGEGDPLLFFRGALMELSP